MHVLDASVRVAHRRAPGGPDDQMVEQHPSRSGDLVDGGFEGDLILA
jgi:hypothetical protein